MSSRSSPEALLHWARGVLGVSEGSLAAVAGDASNRRYFRLAVPGRSYIAVDAPPGTEKNREFLTVREVLEAAGIAVPALYGADLERGFLLLGDFGDRLLLPELDPASVDDWYAGAFDILLKLATDAELPRGWPAYDRALLGEELSRFPEWFLGGLLQRPLAPLESEGWHDLCAGLIDSALEQPSVLVHRDFHSRNLMVLPQDALGVIDFQDAVRGPVTYDLVSLLRDCYLRWSPQRVEGWALHYCALLRARGVLEGVDDAQFIRWFDLMGLQRHLKVLGTFARLYLRDGKPGYLDDLPLVIRYVEEIAGKYRHDWPAAASFADWFEAELKPLIRRQTWGGEL